MDNKIKQELLKQFKKANKERREKIAQKLGYVNGAKYLAFLEGRISASADSVLPAKKKKNIVIHNATLLDATGSMKGGKYENSKKGILKELAHLSNASKNTEGVEYTHSLVEFVQGDKRNRHFFLTKYPTEISWNGANGRNTPLYQAIYEYISQLKKVVKDNDKVLLKIYTDGENNIAYSYKHDCRNLIKKVQNENFTVTFVATKADGEGIIRELDLERSNVLIVDNTEQGFEEAFSASFVATQNYASRVSKGMDVSRNFYKKVGKL